MSSVVSSISLSILIKKILGHNKYLHDQVIKIITSNDTLVNKLYKLSILIKTKNNEHSNRQDFISEKILQLINNVSSSTITSNTTKIVDIGGGNGNVLAYLGSKLGLLKENLIVVEPIMDEWTEDYKCDNPVTYMKWNNTTINIPDKTIDVVIIMVALHHMDDTTISSCLSESQRILKSDGIILIKEHDCDTNIVKTLIDWEHHLYHLCERKSDNDFNTYISKYVDNFKSLSDWDKLISSKGFKLIKHLNRFLEDNDSTNGNDPKNITALYWSIYNL